LRNTSNPTDVYVPTEEDRVEANAKKARELSRKRQDLRNNHPFLMMSKKERESEIEDHYDSRYDLPHLHSFTFIHIHSHSFTFI
jgi:hypothetical protein